MDVSSKVKMLVKEGYKPKQAVAVALSEKRKAAKMANGGMVDNDLDQEHERNLAALMIEGDQPPVANPEVQDMQKKLAMNLQEEAEKEEYYAMGGLVQESQSAEPEAVPEKERMESPKSQLSEDQLKAIAERKLKRKFVK